MFKLFTLAHIVHNIRYSYSSDSFIGTFFFVVGVCAIPFKTTSKAIECGFPLSKIEFSTILNTISPNRQTHAHNTHTLDIKHTTFNAISLYYFIPHNSNIQTMIYQKNEIDGKWQGRNCFGIYLIHSSYPHSHTLPHTYNMSYSFICVIRVLCRE